MPQQNTLQKDFPASVYEVVLSGCITAKNGRIFFGRSLRKTAEENMKKLDIYDIRNKCFRELSGGQQQRVAIARAISNRPNILLADEPTGALDQKTGAAVMELFHELNDDGATIIMITHDAKIAQHAGRIVRILDGNIGEGALEDA